MAKWLLNAEQYPSLHDDRVDDRRGWRRGSYGSHPRLPDAASPPHTALSRVVRPMVVVRSF